jgi:hypothetical protein
MVNIKIKEISLMGVVYKKTVFPRSHKMKKLQSQCDFLSPAAFNEISHSVKMGWGEALCQCSGRFIATKTLV